MSEHLGLSVGGEQESKTLPVCSGIKKRTRSLVFHKPESFYTYMKMASLYYFILAEQ